MTRETGLPAGIVIESKPDEGTKIVITIPISYAPPRINIQISATIATNN